MFMEQLAVAHERYVAALYLRLSHDDENVGESESIQNQRVILREYAEKNNIRVYKEYIDDGWSGTNFNRPSFQSMLHDIELKKINCVITKDLSRFGRNYIEVGNFLEFYFPRNGIRYIAISDGIDSMKGDSDIAPFLNIFNEMYARQSSQKVKQVYASKFEQGYHYSMIMPYGYKRDPDHKGKVLVNEETQWVIKKMFSLALEGYTIRKIMQWLEDNRIETPGYYNYKKYGIKPNHWASVTDEKRYLWNRHIVRKMLSDEFYLGNSIHYRYRTVSYKDPRKVAVPKSQWLIVKNTHDALVSEEDFKKVQELIEQRKRTCQGAVESGTHIFAGLLKCADCGWNLRSATNRQQKGKEYQYFCCMKRNERHTPQCSLHYIRYDVLKACILKRLQELYDTVNIDREGIISKLEKSDTEQMELLKDKKELDRLSARKKDIDRLFVKIYEDRISGVLSERNFDMMSQKYQTEQTEIDTKIEQLNKKIAEREDKTAKVKKWLNLIDKYSYPTELTYEMVHDLIEKIVVHESEGPKGGRSKKQVIEVYYRFVGKL